VAIVDMSDASANNDFIAVPLSVVDDSSTTTSLSGSYYDYGQLRLYPDGQVRLYPEPRENSEVAAESEEDSEDEEEVAGKADPIIFYLCGQSPCDWDTYGEELWEECNRLKEAGADNKAVCFHAYKLYTWMGRGVLHHFDRRPLPVCARGEILDS
jgi:hypothetical protein